MVSRSMYDEAAGFSAMCQGSTESPARGCGLQGEKSNPAMEPYYLLDRDVAR